MYSAEISRVSPAMILFLLDQSGSMQDGWPGGAGQTKADGLATILNRLLFELTLRSAKSEGVRDYFEVGVIGYGDGVGPGLGGVLAGRELVKISEIANFPARVEDREKREADGAGGIVSTTVKFPVWVDAKASGGTPMCSALGKASDAASNWASSHSNSYPPIVVNITDGESTDGDPTAQADNVRSVHTSDGAALLFNIHISSKSSEPIVFPADELGLPDDYARLLFRTASYLPDQMVQSARQTLPQVAESAKGFVFNGDMVSVITALDIGTRPSDLR